MSDDIDDLRLELAAAHPGARNYADLDRYRDFRAVFLATDQGKRVLHEILSMGMMYAASGPMANYEPFKAMHLDGRRALALKILLTTHLEPAERPTRATSTEPEGER